MEYIKPIVVAISVYMVPVWYLTECAAWLFEARQIRKGVWAQFALRVLPMLFAFVLVSLSPGLLAEVLQAFRGVPHQPPTTSELALFALVTGAAAVQLHQWRIPQLIGAGLRNSIRRVSGTADKEKPP